MKTKILKCLNFGILVAVLVYPKICRSAIKASYNQNADRKILTNLNEVQGFDYSAEEMEKLKIWQHGIIPYFIDLFSFDKVLRDRIRVVFKDANNYGGVRFTELNKPPANDKERYVFLLNRQGHSGCSDPPYYNMTSSGVQKVILGYDCMSYGDLAAITLSILGIGPQHNAPNRDQYITVRVDNALDNKKHLFEKLPNNLWLFHDEDYDYDSATHFHFHQYTSNGKATLIPADKILVPPGVSLGDPDSFSYRDVMKMRMLYNYIHYKHGDVDSKDCTELFRPGNYTDKVGSQSSEEVKTPRVKPTLYTFGNSTETTPDKGSEEEQSAENEEKKTSFKH